jgi:hypothetical protein
VLRRAGHEDAAAELATIWTDAYPEGAARYPVFETARREGRVVVTVEVPDAETGAFDRTFELLRDLRQAGV